MVVQFRLSDYKIKGLNDVHQIQIYVSHLKKRVYLDTGVKVTKDQFDPNADQKIIGKGKEIQESNDKLFEQLAKVKKIIRDYRNEHDDIDPDVFYVRDQFFKPKIQQSPSYEVKAVFHKWLYGDPSENIQGKKHKVADSKIYRTVYNDIVRLFPNSLYFKDINEDFFQKLMSDWTSPENNLQNSTINKRTTCLKIFLRHEPKNKFKYFEKFTTGLKNPKSKPVIIPTIEEFEKIVNAEWYIDKDKFTSDMDTARDYFVIGCTTSLRYCTISSLSRSDVIFDSSDKLGYINTFSSKTETSDVIIPLNDISRVFIEKLFQKSRNNYRIKYMSNWKVNENLHTLFEELKFSSFVKVIIKRGASAVAIEMVKYKAMTMHSSRKFFMSTCVNSNVVSLGTTLVWSTHTDLQNVVRYIGKGHKEAEQMRELFANIILPKDSFPLVDASTLLRIPDETVEKEKKDDLEVKNQK